MVTRIRQLLDWQQLSPTQFADLIGVGRPVMSHILSERNKPSLEVFQRIVEAFPAVSMAWLLSGTGEMLTTAASMPATASTPTPAPSIIMAAVTPSVAATSPLTAPSAASPAPVGPAASATRRAGAASTPAPARFVQPGMGQTMVAAAPLAATSPVAAAPELAALPPLPTELAPAPGSSSTAAAPPQEVVSRTNGPATDASWLAPLAEPGKAIRRIVIFYRDGSFADYQPEG